jgi:hypothetical protein
VASHTEYPSMDDYLAGYAITGDRLATLAAPASVFVSLDHPIIEAKDLSRLARVAGLSITTTAHGGHCGFIENLGDGSWMDRRVLRLVAEP